MGYGESNFDQPDANLGTWRLVAVVADGKPVSIGTNTTMYVTPDGYTVKVGHKVYERGVARADRSVIPVESDVMVEDGPRAGQIFRQISLIEGDVMIACAGDDRPSAFESRPGSGHTLSVWLRV